MQAPISTSVPIPRSPYSSTQRFSTTYNAAPQMYVPAATAPYRPAGMSYVGAQSAATLQSTVQYTSEASQRYQPSGCQPVATFPHGITTIYSTGLVPAFMAPPDVQVSPQNVARWTHFQQESSSVASRP